jgi:predicted amidohydrolase
MQDMRVTLVQANQIWENKQANFNHYEELLKEVETDLIVLPEMFHTGFTMNANSLSERMDSSEGLDFLRRLAAKHGSAVYTSLIIEDNGKFRNRGVFIRTDGRLEYYDKRKSFGLGGEDKVFTSGERGQIVEYKGWKINLQICYDLRFPEITRNSLDPEGRPNYDLILYVANWPQRRSIHWKTLCQARAIENQAYVVGVNRVGTDGNGLVYSGDSVVIDALGNVHYAGESLEIVKTYTLNVAELSETRKGLPFLKDA